MTDLPHFPVMCKEAIEALQLRAGGIYVDGTFGYGGYTRAMLDAADCKVVAFDRDPTAIERAQSWVGDYGDRLTLLQRPFAQMQQGLKDLGIQAVDGIVLDLGVSSMQLDEAERGFSFAKDGPLNMRMDGDETALTAKQLVAEASEKLLADIIHFYGEDRKARAIARVIVKEREKAPITTTLQLADVVLKVAGPLRPDRIHPATRTFQALRIYVNDELGQLVNTLLASEDLLKTYGRLVVVTFHSLEDRLVKRFFIERTGNEAKPSRHLPDIGEATQASLSLITRKAALPSDVEISLNPRSRSAKMRVAERTAFPPTPIPKGYAQRLGLPPVNPAAIV